MSGIIMGLIASFKRVFSWTQNTGFPSATKVTGAMSYGAGLFVIGTSSDTPSLAQSIYTSADGVTWSDIASPSGYSHLANNAYGNGIFVLCSYYYSDAATSTDGVTWTARSFTGLGNYSLFFGDGIFFRPVAYDSRVDTSTDGINWTNRSLPSNRTWQRMAWGNGTYVMQCMDAAYCLTSPNGTTWTERSMPNIYDGALMYVGGLFVMFFSGGPSRFATSPDGITWTNRTTTATYCATSSVGNGLAVMPRSNGESDSLISTDGITWTVKSHVSAGPYTSIAHSGSKFVAKKDSSTTVAIANY
jgi:hypothetical protein